MDIKIYYMNLGGNLGYTAIKLRSERIIKTYTLKQFFKLACKDDITVSRVDLVSVLEEIATLI